MPILVEDSTLTETYMVHSAFLAIKLLILSPIPAMTWVRQGIFSNPDMVRRAYLSELRLLAPFWLVGAMYLTTNPNPIIGIVLFRLYTAARIILMLGYVAKPAPALFTDIALVISYFINWYMTIVVVLCYWQAI